MNPANLPILDSGTGTDGALGGGWSGNKVNTGEGAIPVRASNKFAMGATAGGTYWATSYSDNPGVGVRMKFDVLPTSPMYLELVKTGNSASPDYYRLRYNPGGATPDFQVQRVNAGASTFLHGDDIANKPISAGDELALMKDNNGVVTAWVFHGGSWVQISTGTDASPLTGPFFPGLLIGDATMRGSNFGGGQESVAATLPKGAAATVGSGG